MPIELVSDKQQIHHTRHHLRYLLLAAVIFVSLLARPVAAAEVEQSDIDSLQQQLRQLENRLELLQGSTIAQKEQVTEKSSDAEPSRQAVKFGGALRFNYFVTDYDESQKTRRGDIGYDLFRINADGKFDKLFLSTEYRFYRFMNAIHHGYVGYQLGDHSQLRAGISKVPFGLLPYASHNYWFGVPFYLGLSDDYDSGVKYRYQNQSWDWQLAFFKNEELGNAADLERYGYDPVTTGAARNQETNTFNTRLAYTYAHNTDCKHELGVSAQAGELFNVDTGETGDHWAVASHLDSRCGRWNVQLEVARYGFDARNPVGVSDRTVTLGGFADSYDIAARGTVYVANVAYNIPVQWEGIKLLTCYNDFSMLDKDVAAFDNSYINTTGCLINAGPTYTYVDLIRGRNMKYLGSGSLAGGGANEWETRFNINFGIYW